MLAFFDTNVHIALLRNTIDLDALLAQVGRGPIRMSPIVASELLRGARGQAVRSIEKLIVKLIPLEPDAWRPCWHEAGRLCDAPSRITRASVSDACKMMSCWR